MKQLLALLLIMLACGITQRLPAQESPTNELAYIRYLRAKGWNDLAKTRIEKLLPVKDPLLQASLPLELARVNIAYARQLPPEQRPTLFNDARKQLLGYIQKNLGKAAAAMANVELARLTSFHAQDLLARAMREEENKARHEKARPAEAMFIQAGKDLEAAAKLLEQALADPKNVNDKEILQRELLQARFDLAINLFNQARTYIDTDRNEINQQRSFMVDAAKKSFTALRDSDSTEVGWLANAWLMKCAIEHNDPDNTEKYYNLVVKARDDKSAHAAVRLVKLFHLQDIAPPRVNDVETIGKNPKYGKMKEIDRARLVQKEAEQWLKTYGGHVKTFEGQGVMYELALAYLFDARNEKDQKLSQTKLKKAEEFLDALVKLDGEHAERAKPIITAIKFQRVASQGILKTFDDYVMKAMLERDKVRELNDRWEKADDTAEQKKVDLERKKHLKGAIDALDTAMALASGQTPVQKLDEARNLLSGAHLANGDPYRAAVVAEALARQRPATRQSAEGAATAIATYASLANAQAQDAAIRRRLEDLAQYVLSPDLQQAWKSEPVTSLAHYHLAMQAKRDSDPKKAIAHLEKLAPEFTDYPYTQGQLIFIAQEAREKKPDDKKEQQFYVNAVKAAVQRIPTIQAKESTAVITMYFFAKMEWAKLLYAEAMDELQAREELKAAKKCSDMTKYLKDLISEFDKVPPAKITKENREQLQFSMAVMLKYADLGFAEAKFRGDSKDRFDQVVKVTDKVVQDVLKISKSTPAPQPIRLKNHRVTGDILSLALRAHIQKGDVAKAKAMLDVLKRLSGPDASAPPGNVVTALLNDIAAQIKALSSEKDSSLKAIRGNYTAFLEEMAKDFDKRGWDERAAIMLGQAYISLDYPCKAAQAFSKLKPPASIDKKIDKNPAMKETEAEVKERERWEDEVRQYWSAQIEYVRALRACHETDALKTAEKAITAMLKHPNARFQVQAMMERNLLLEDQQRFREAYTEWSKKFLTMPSLVRDLTNKDAQKIYFEGYFYSARTLYKTAVLDPSIKDRKRLVVAAANLIIKLEFASTPDGWQVAGPMFQKLLEAEAPLKDQYDQLKANRKQ